LYDEKILEEEQILQWYDAVPVTNGAANGSEGSKAALVRKSARPVVDWLRSAEAESEEDE
jgi:translation initiation factor 5